MTRKPLHPLFFALYPALALLATNIVEVETFVVIRPLLFSILLAAILSGICFLLSRSSIKAAVLTTILLITFFSYGHIYQLLHSLPDIGVQIGRHRYLAPIYGLVTSILLMMTIRRKQEPLVLTEFLNVSGLALVIFTLYPILTKPTAITITETDLNQIYPWLQPITAQPEESYPDIYYIILDAYTRADALAEDYQLDISPYLAGLEELGFYIADCSRPNYAYTQGSLTSSLNLNYLSELDSALDYYELEADDIWLLMQQSLVRTQLESLGYQIVSFETGFDWSQIKDADIYISQANRAINRQAISAFENMLLESTAISFLMDMNVSLLQQRLDSPFKEHYQRQLFVLEQIPELTSISEPKFAFIHLLMPHVPLVFAADGSFQEDPGYYAGDLWEPVNDQYLRDGYTAEIEYLNTRMLKIVGTIITKSERDVIIIMQADHGLKGENRYEIFNVYYTNASAQAALYSTITPVNSFRVIFNQYFGTDYTLLDDLTFENNRIVPETSATCVEHTTE